MPKLGLKIKWKLVQLLSHCIFNENLQKSELTTPQSMGQDQCLGTLINN